MMFIVIGLGNPGHKYVNTKHNIGHIVLSGLNLDDRFYKLRTDCFMNNSGEFVKNVLDEHGVRTAHLIVIHDDWDFDIGEYKLQFNRGANHHRGIESIIAALGTKEFWRVRVGIGPINRFQASRDFVLERLDANQMKKIKETIPSIEYDIVNKDVFMTTVNNV